MRSKALASALVVVFGVQPSPLLAETLSDSTRVETVLRRGDVIRISYQDPKTRTVQGEVKDLAHDSVTLKTYDVDATAAVEATVPLHQITRIEQRVGSHGNFGPGAALGGIVGGVLGAVLVAVTSKSELGYVPGNDVATGFLFGAGIGIAIGGLVGATIRSTDWHEVPAADWPH